MSLSYVQRWQKTKIKKYAMSSEQGRNLGDVQKNPVRTSFGTAVQIHALTLSTQDTPSMLKNL